MEIEQRVQTLEQEVQLIKAQIQATLLDIQEYLLTNNYSTLRKQDQKAIRRTEELLAVKSAQALPSPTPSTQPAPVPVATATRETPPRRVENHYVQPQPQPQPAQPPQRPTFSEQDWQALSTIVRWLAAKVKELGPQRVHAAIEVYAQKNRIAPEVLDTLLEFVMLYGDQAPHVMRSMRANGNGQHPAPRTNGHNGHQPYATPEPALAHNGNGSNKYGKPLTNNAGASRTMRAARPRRWED